MIPVTPIPPLLEGAILYGLTGDGREVCVYPRFFNSIIVIGQTGSAFTDDQW